MANDIMQYIKERLEEWADWCMRSQFSHLGYGKSLLAHLRESGGMLIHSTAPSNPYLTHPRAEEIENFIKEMAEQNYKIATALRCQYLLQGTDRDKARVMSRVVKVSYAQYRVYISMAYHWLAGRFSARHTFS